jgi:hypothetical protein
MQTAQDSTLAPPGATATGRVRPRLADHASARRAVAWAVRIGLLAILFVIPLAAYL